MPIRESDADTISAIATPPGEGGVGIVRLSGPRALEIGAAVFRAKGGEDPLTQKDHTVRYGRVLDGERILDEVLLLVMRGPRSFTGEDVVEIQAHGGPAVLQSILALTVRHGARLAAPGEFTKRAFLHGRIDLLQAEAVLDLIQAKTERSLRWAASQLDGELSRRLRPLKDSLLATLAHLEAAVDFPEDHPETDTLPAIDRDLGQAQTAIAALLQGADLALSVKRGIRAVLWGRPNVGKSSLLNALTRTDRVIVTPHPGTTRDVVEEEAVIEGYPVRFVDTAGVQSTDHPIEKEGIERSRRAAAGADLVLFVLDSSQSLAEDDRKLWASLAGRPVIAVLNKADLPWRLDSAQLTALGVTEFIRTSCAGKPGIEALLRAIVANIAGGRTEAAGEPVVHSIRQKEHLEKALESIGAARLACAKGLSYEFIASDVRLSLDALGRLVGEIFNDDMLEILFQRFCIGK